MDTIRYVKASKARSSAVTFIGAVGLATLLTGCVQTTYPDGTSTAKFIAVEVGRVALVCVEEDFSPPEVRARLIAAGFVEKPDIFGPFLFRSPPSAGPRAQGVAATARRPCSPKVNAVFAQESIDATALALITVGFRPTNDGDIFVRGSQQVRLRGSAPEIGGLAVIDIEPVR